MNNTAERIQQIKQAIIDANSNGPIADLKLNGATGSKVIGILQRFANLLPEDQCYVEIGVVKGMSLINTAFAAPKIEAFGIDNFAQFDKDKKNQTIIEERCKNHQVKNTRLINLDFEEALENLEKYIGNKKIGLFFIDGPHDYRSQLVCLIMAKKHLAENCIILVDNSNYNHVRQANRDFLASHPEYKMIFEAYSKSHPANLRGAELDEAWKNWLDGINVIIKDNLNLLTPMLPYVNPDKEMFFNDHKIHPMRNSIFAWRAAKLAAVIKPFKPYYFFGFLWKLWTSVRRRKSSEIEPYLFINSFSEKLPTFNLNKSV
jgi:hypothetical protein